MKLNKLLKNEFIKFCIAGGCITATDFGVYYSLYHFISFNAAKGISFACAGVLGYLLCKYWTFKNDKPSVAEAVRYAFINTLALGINVYTNHYVLAQGHSTVFLSLVTATAVTGSFTFVCFKWWVFKDALKEGFFLMWWRIFPWKFLVRDAARRQGFIDPIRLLSQLQNFAQPSEVAAPTELLRSGVVLHARGLINSLAIQHNLDWIWPYWVECQYDPHNDAFIPRSFSLTQINLTHRNWTALGVPGGEEFPLVDPRGLLTPYYDGWSIDVWIIPEEGEPLIPSRCLNVSQNMVMENNICVFTVSNLGALKLQLEAQVIGNALAPVCQLKVTGFSVHKANLVISLRPYNPEGISFINHIVLLEKVLGWQVNGKDLILFDKPPNTCLFSDYTRGDVYSRLSSAEAETGVSCKVGMASAAVLYQLNISESLDVMVSLPLTAGKKDKNKVSEASAQEVWAESLQGVCALQIPDEHFMFLYNAAIYTMILHSPREVYPGPFIYRRFWFRDAAFILNALLCAGLKGRVKNSLDCFRTRQTAQGYFLSQEGEWDSNGEALWIMAQYCEMTGALPPQEWENSIKKGGEWICRKRLPNDGQSPHAGLLPSGFSAEHLGPNDFYYWDDFWSVAGLKAAAFLCAAYEDNDAAIKFKKESGRLLESIDHSLKQVEARLIKAAMPASPYRRMDTGAVGSLVAGYPLRILKPDDPRMINTADFLMKNCLVHGGFFHNMTHSGINPYLSLHLAQVLLRAGDPGFFGLMSAVAKLASPTGQWPESIHPLTGGGCMGDGQHVWAAAEWVLMIRNCFVREEGEGLIFCSGVPKVWLDQKQELTFGPAPTSFGDVHISIKPGDQSTLIEWSGAWFRKEPAIDILLTGFKKVRIVPGTHSLELKAEGSHDRSSYIAV